MNPAWYEEDPDPSEAFKKAMDWCEEEFIAHLHSGLKVARPARKLVEEAWEGRKEFHESGEFLWFPKSCPWKGHMFNIEKEQGEEGLIKFVFF